MAFLHLMMTEPIFHQHVPKTFDEVKPAVTTPLNDFQEDPFKSSHPIEGKTNGFANDPFSGEDPFKSDPFVDTNVAAASDPFRGDPFESAFNVTASQ
ncbi:epidermal growth factor receptor substrate 15-like [Parasteatoda tepidariorum]|uniref:epidermal growth factor receptor substrate 15-like n=1 Tax=Parasteatoda tepidariorum TaxID=114398 RepID=UPI0039BD00BC